MESFYTRCKWYTLICSKLTSVKCEKPSTYLSLRQRRHLRPLDHTARFWDTTLARAVPSSNQVKSKRAIMSPDGRIIGTFTVARSANCTNIRGSMVCRTSPRLFAHILYNTLIYFRNKHTLGQRGVQSTRTVQLFRRIASSDQRWKWVIYGSPFLDGPRGSWVTASQWPSGPWR